MPVNPGHALGQEGVDEDEDDALIPPLGPAAPVPDVAIPVGDPGVADVPDTSPMAPAGSVPAVILVCSASAPTVAAPKGPVGIEVAAAPLAPVIPYSIGSVAGIELAPGGAFSPEGTPHRAAGRRRSPRERPRRRPLGGH
ncbi:hypothetical protein FGB62_237g03 [Gracilaria domingensis]|nr:hypothetical protein FGB62_237g03 [Gracilaria domingensis]